MGAHGPRRRLEGSGPLSPDERDGAEPPPPGRRLYGRGQGRPLSARRQTLVETLLPEIGLPAEGSIDPKALFPLARSARLEIGFGGGEHLVAQAEANPDVGFIGVEPFEEGVGKALSLIQERGVSNVRVHRGDGRDVLDRIPDAALDTIYVLFPDPWPKSRHFKRRLIQPDVVASMARALIPGGRLRVATDVRSYVAWTLRIVRADGAFAWTARRPEDWRQPPADHQPTRYQLKNLGDCPPTFLDFKRQDFEGPDFERPDPKRR